MLYFRAKVQRYKKAQGWAAEGRRSAGFVGDEPGRRVVGYGDGEALALRHEVGRERHGHAHQGNDQGQKPDKAYAVLRDEGYVRMRGRAGAVIADPAAADRADADASAQGSRERPGAEAREAEAWGSSRSLGGHRLPCTRT